MASTLRGRLRRLAGATLALVACTAWPAQAQNTVKVGLLLTYSGPSALTGQINDNTVKLFQQQFGTSAGGTRIEFVRRDTTGPNPETARRLAQELIVRERVQIIVGPDFTPNVLAVAPLLSEGKVPALLTGAATQGIVGEKSPYLLRTFYSVPQVVRPLAQWAWRNGIRKPYTVVADYGPGHDSQASFTKAFTEAGGGVAGALRVSLRNPEMASYMQRIKDARPDAVFAFFPIGELNVQFLKAFSDAGLKSAGIRLIGPGDLSDESTVDAAGDAALGAITSGIYASVLDNAANKAFVAGYQARFGTSPRIGWSSVAVWDALRLIYDGVAAQGQAPFDADKFIAFARGRSFDSPRGPVSLDKTTGDITQNVYIRRVERRDGVLHNVTIDTFNDQPPR